ncbi:uncharacterized protein H6S33_006617 [Morchella sextelata]|uniref:uncharacterized protein n=1 Tax=Morchella sextelata TaxID=1174677 RepID=UPI001D042B1D|nr:uncharacterized protein H6S33_006617 [Morchella sextelata]KAH0604240.1 hypothetical protein H6S33_006617 [Morchella sextelata]
MPTTPSEAMVVRDRFTIEKWSRKKPEEEGDFSCPGSLHSDTPPTCQHLSHLASVTGFVVMGGWMYVRWMVMVVGVRSGRGLKDRGSFKGMCTLHDSEDLHVQQGETAIFVRARTAVQYYLAAQKPFLQSGGSIHPRYRARGLFWVSPFDVLEISKRQSTSSLPSVSRFPTYVGAVSEQLSGQREAVVASLLSMVWV